MNNPPQPGQLMTSVLGYKFQVKQVADNRVYFGRPDLDFASQSMPLEAWPHFCTDLNKQVHTGLNLAQMRGSDGIVLAVASGLGTWLNRGNSGSVYRFNNYAVKVSSTIPFHPENPGHLTIEESIQQLRKEYEIYELLLAKKVPGILPVYWRTLGEKAFLVMPLIKMATKENPLTLDQCKAIAATIHRLHGLGYCYGDGYIQAGLWNGLPFLIDLGEAQPYGTGRGVWCNRKSDIESLNRFMEDMGHTPYLRERSRVICDKKVEKFLNGKTKAKARKKLQATSPGS